MTILGGYKSIYTAFGTPLNATSARPNVGHLVQSLTTARLFSVDLSGLVADHSVLIATHSHE